MALETRVVADDDELSAQERHRLKRQLGQTGISVAKLRRRASTRRLEAHPSVLARMAKDKRLVRTGVSAAADHGVDVVAEQRVEAYVRESDEQAFMANYDLVASAIKWLWV